MRRNEAEVDAGAAAGSVGVLVAMTTTMVLLVLDSSIVGVMLPSMTDDLELSVSDQAWVVTSYLVFLAVALPIGGKLSDALGPVTMFVVGMSGFVGASVGIALAGSPGSLIAWRSVAGVAAGLLMPATMSVLVRTFGPERRAHALGVYTGVGQGFATVGPVVGGVCADFLGWQWGFLVNVPVGLVGLALVWRIRPANLRTSVVTWDLLGTSLLVVGIGALITGLLQAPSAGWLSPGILAALLLGGVGLAVFVVRASRTPGGVLNVRLFLVPVFTAGTLVLFCLGFAMTVATIYGAVALQDSLQLAPAVGGVALLPMVLPVLIATRWAARNYVTQGPRRLGIGGSVSLAGGLVVMAIGLGANELLITCAGMILVGCGIGVLMSPITTAALSATPENQSGQASGAVSMCRQLGGIIGVGVFSALVVALPGAGPSTTSPGVVIGFVVAAAVMIGALIAAMIGLPRRQLTP